MSILKLKDKERIQELSKDMALKGEYGLAHGIDLLFYLIEDLEKEIEYLKKYIDAHIEGEGC